MDFTTNNKKRHVSIAEETVVSNLPEHVMDSVLERLPIQDIIRTSILSKKWRHKWTTTRALVFDEQFSQKFEKHGFVRIINQVLLFHKGSINKFYLNIPSKYLDSFQEVDQSLFLLSAKGVEDLTLASSNKPFQFPPTSLTAARGRSCYLLPLCVFSCLELRKLELSNFIFKPPLQFEGFLFLESLILNYIDFTTDVVGTVINLPQLKMLTMHSCTNTYNLKIKATKLQSLVVKNCHDVRLLELLHSQHLASVCIILGKPIKDYVRIERMKLAFMFSNMPKVQCLSIDAHFLKVFNEEKPKWFPHAVNTLRRLRLIEFSIDDLNQLQGVLCLLRNSPNLEELCLTHIGKVKSSFFLSTHTQSSMEATSNHLESPDCLDQTLHRLRTVELSPLDGSKPELLFIKLLLAHSPSLEKLTIQSIATLKDSQRFNIAKDIMRFPRASSKAEIIYLDPSHDGRGYTYRKIGWRKRRRGIDLVY